MVTRQPKMELLHSLASELLLVPLTSSQKLLLENRIGSLYTDWDELCQQCVPAGVLPLVTTPTGMGGSLSFQPPGEFDDMAQMLEWLILIESKLQPARISIGDFVHLKKLLRDLVGIERELKLREKDYKKFMSEVESSDEICSLLDSDPERALSVSNSSLVATATMVAVSLSPSKGVKFTDESTLERNLRQEEIKQCKVCIIQPNGEEIEMCSDLIDSDPAQITGSGGNASSGGPIGFIPYHSIGPIAGKKDGSKVEGLGPLLRVEPNSSSPLALAPHQSRILRQISSDPEGSLSRLVSTAGSAPLSSISEEHYHLALLWKGVWSGLFQERARLGEVQERWRHFEGIKEEFSTYLFKAEERMAYFFRVVGNTKNFGVIQTEIAAQKVRDCVIIPCLVHPISPSMLPCTSLSC